jgi:hypothetical protein
VLAAPLPIALFAGSERYYQSGYPWLVLQEHPRRVAVKMADAVLVLAHGPRPEPVVVQKRPRTFNAVLHKDVLQLQQQQQQQRAAKVHCEDEASPWMPRKKRCGSKACVSPVCLFFSNQVGACEQVTVMCLALLAFIHACILLALPDHITWQLACHCNGSTTPDTSPHCQ